jgi:hypothetical protein
MDWFSEFTTELLKRLEDQHVLIIVIVALVVITSLLVWGARKNREVTFFWGAIKLSPRKSSIDPVVIEETRSLLETTRSQLVAIREEIVTEIHKIAEEERQLSDKLLNPNILPMQQHHTATLIDKATTDRKRLEKNIVDRLDALKSDFSKVKDYLDKAKESERKAGS